MLIMKVPQLMNLTMILMKAHVDLDFDDLKGDGGDIDLLSELDPDQSNGHGGLDLLYLNEGTLSRRVKI